MTTYSTLLNTPEWKKFRLGVLIFYGNKCKECAATSSLQVHHRYYIRGRMPWNYAMHELEVLCAKCHAAHHPRQNLKANLMRRLAVSQGLEREALLAAIAKLKQ